ncbi:flagellar hook assembly protein FlgD [Providencia sneebia]|uniref:Basal-body rod modification protein FlgD n=1 Tax=Providencia sneebia DSM 19967 TaxID=1141660 RepID=K8WD47_9GAMM|nr:flagellar hook capping FlgD N-terminal domain-containing protein [Providencia sneebia]EKT58558.1 flagellar initiation of hook assembly [Providencia sneebia DSM 19967]
MSILAPINEPLNNSASISEPLNNHVPKKSQSDDMRDTFLKMIVTQMQNQDPTNPLDNKELTSQLAQIASLESMNRLSDHIGGISQQINTGQSLQATQLVGKGVLIPGNEIMLGRKNIAEDKIHPTSNVSTHSFTMFNSHNLADKSENFINDYISSPFGFQLSKNAENVEIIIRDKNKNIIRNFNYDKPLKADLYDLYWDGKDNQGNYVLNTNGKYFFDVKATNNGSDVSVTKLGYSRVNGVVSGEDAPLLDVGIGQSIPLRHILKVYPNS